MPVIHRPPLDNAELTTVVDYLMAVESGRSRP
jgi:hypothetical protein